MPENCEDVSSYKTHSIEIYTEFSANSIDSGHYI